MVAVAKGGGEEGGGAAAYRRLVVEHLAQLDDARMRRESPQRLDLAQVVDLPRERPGWRWARSGEVGTGRCLLEAVKVVLHALDGDILAVLDALRLQDLGEGALALFTDESILWQGRHAICLCMC